MAGIDGAGPWSQLSLFGVAIPAAIIADTGVDKSIPPTATSEPSSSGRTGNLSNGRRNLQPVRPRSTEPRPVAHKALLDPKQLALILGITERHVKRLVAERRIPFVKVGRFVRFERSAVDEWVKRATVEARR